MGGRGAHTLTQVAKAARLDPAFVRELLQAIGRPSPGRGEKVLTDEDLVMAQAVRAFLDAGLPRAEVVEIARVLGRTMANLADAIRRAAGDALLKRGDSEEAVGLRYAEAAESIGPLVPHMLDYAFRLHMRDGVSRALITEAERKAGRLAGTQDVAAAFADLVGYTKLGEKRGAEDAGRIAGRLAALSTKSIRPPVQLVKTIGDAAMFVSPEIAPLVETLVALRTAVAKEKDFPAVRIGIAYGPATTRGGDWFGSTINAAARITDLAKGGQILGTEPVQEATAARPWKRRRKRSLKGLDERTRLHSLDP